VRFAPEINGKIPRVKDWNWKIAAVALIMKSQTEKTGSNG